MTRTTLGWMLAVSCLASLGFDFRNGVPEGMALRGESRLVDDAEHGRVLQVGWGEPNRPEGLWLRSAKSWCPAEGFRIKVVFKLSPQPKDQRQLVLVDNKGLYLPPAERTDRHCGWALILAGGSSGTYVPTGYFGHGSFSQAAKGQALKLCDDHWHQLEMLFSGAGEVTFTVDGQWNATCPVTPGAIAMAKLPTVFGDRAVGNYNASGAQFAAFEITPIAIPSLSLSVFGRTTFPRLEPDANLHVRLRNNSDRPLSGLKLNGVELGAISPQGEASVALPVDTVLLPGVYKVPLAVRGARELTTETEIFIAPSSTAAIPVLMRRGPVNDLLPYYGFTHQMIHLTDALGADSSPQSREAMCRQIDAGVRHGLRWVDIISIGHTLARRGEFVRIDRDGRPYARANLEASNPAVQDLFVKYATIGAAAIHGNPFVDITVVNNEVRDGSMPSFGQFEPANYRQFSGSEIPAEVRGRSYSYSGIPGFPKSRVVPDDYPLLKYYRWFFKDGDGWNVLQRRTNRVYKDTVTRPNFHTIYDPITRVPPLWGSGGDVDGMSQWVYSNPDPVKASLVLDELEAMGRAFSVPRQIHLCIQSIWYRRQTAPLGVQVDNPPQWLSQEPEAQFITIAPDHVREAIWLAVAHRLDGLATHGYGSLIEPQTHGYRYTHPESREVFKRMVEQVVRPLGPVVKSVPERRPDLVILESFAAQIFAGHGTNGWGHGWIADLYLALQWAHYQPGVIYEEELLRDRLAGIKVLVLPGCEVLPQSVYDEIKWFQRRGGIIVGDEYLVPGIIPDVSVSSVTRKTADAAGSKTALQTLGAAIRAELNEVYQPGVDADSPDIVVRRRSCGEADYLFVINDKRTYGDYVGQWRMVMEEGLPNGATVTVDRACGAAYDLMAHQAIPFASTNGKTRLRREFATNDGTCVLLLDRPIAAVAADVPEKVVLGQRFQASVTLLDADGKPVPAWVPVQVSLLNAAGEELDGSGYFCTKNPSQNHPRRVERPSGTELPTGFRTGSKNRSENCHSQRGRPDEGEPASSSGPASENGRLVIDFTPSRNDLPGELTFRVRCLASGQTIEKKLHLVKP